MIGFWRSRLQRIVQIETNQKGRARHGNKNRWNPKLVNYGPDFPNCAIGART